MKCLHFIACPFEARLTSMSKRKRTHNRLCINETTHSITSLSSLCVNNSGCLALCLAFRQESSGSTYKALCKKQCEGELRTAHPHRTRTGKCQPPSPPNFEYPNIEHCKIAGGKLQHHHQNSHLLACLSTDEPGRSCRSRQDDVHNRNSDQAAERGPGKFCAAVVSPLPHSFIRALHYQTHDPTLYVTPS